jgi:hypothetical protein
MRARVMAILIVCMGFAPSLACAQVVRVYPIDDPSTALAPIALPGGATLRARLALGAGAFRHRDDPARTIWVVSGRGPNYSCPEASVLTGIRPRDFCGGAPREGRLFVLPDHAIAIRRLNLSPGGGLRTEETIVLRDREGRPLTGLPTPRPVVEEIAIDLRGQALPPDPGAVDPAALARRSDGTFWIAEQSAPSLLHVAADGTVLARHVPRGLGIWHEDAAYPIESTLPGLLAWRQRGRGFAALALSPDEENLYVMTQSPLALPDARAARESRTLRMFRIELATMKVASEHLYLLDGPQSFKRDAELRAGDVRVTEMVALSRDRLLVVERGDKTVKLYEVQPESSSDIAGGDWDDPFIRPALEETGPRGASLAPMTKVLRLDSAAYPHMPGRIGAAAVMGDGTLALIAGDETVLGDEPLALVIVIGLGIEARR